MDESGSCRVIGRIIGVNLNLKIQPFIKIEGKRIQLKKNSPRLISLPMGG
jgi:hypothetical protein